MARVQFCLQIGQGLPVLMDLAGQMDLNIVACGPDPDDVVHRHQQHLFILAYCNAVQVLVALAQLVQRLENAGGMHRHGGGCRNPPLHADQRFGKALAAERFDQIVHRVRFKRLHGILLEGGYKHGGRHAFGTDGGNHVQTGNRWHLDVEEHQVGRVRA